MEPIDFEQANKTLLAPHGQEAEIEPLRVFSQEGICISCWKPTIRERLSILLFGRVWLWVISGETQPPVAMIATRTIFGSVDQLYDTEQR